MRASSPPPEPDPFRVAAAQQLANIETAEANTALANADEYTPEGSALFEQTAPIEVETYQYDASGNLTGTTTRSIKRWKRTVSLSATQQSLFDQQQQLSSLFNGWAINQVEQLQLIMADPLNDTGLTPRHTTPSEPTLITTAPTPGSLVETIGSTDLVAHIEATRDAIEGRVEYNIDRDRTKMITELEHQMIYPGSKAYINALDTFDKASTDARTESYLKAQQEQSRIIQLEGVIAQFANSVVQMKFDQSIMQIDVENSNLIRQYQVAIDLCNYINTLRNLQLQEDITIRSQTINEVSALVSGGQVQIPRFQNYQGGSVATTPVGDYVYRSSAYRLSAWQGQVQQQNQVFGGILGFGGNLAGGAAAIGGRAAAGGFLGRR